MMTHVRISLWTMIPKGVPLDTYAFRRMVAPDVPVAFLGGRPR
jgi:hypothetical protein